MTYAHRSSAACLAVRSHVRHYIDHDAALTQAWIPVHDAVHPEAEGERRIGYNWVAVQLIRVLECGNIQTIRGSPFGG